MSEFEDANTFIPHQETTEQKSTSIIPNNRVPPDLKSNRKNAELSDIFLKNDIHGLSDFFEAAGKREKAFWTIIILGAVFLLGYELVWVSLDFINNPIITTYNLVADPSGMDFPEIYICPPTPIHAKRDGLINVTWKTDMEIDKFFKTATAIVDEEEGSVLGKKTPLWDKITTKLIPQPVPFLDIKKVISTDPFIPYVPTSISDYFMKAGYSREILFKECSYGGTNFPCNSPAVMEIFNRDYGKCFLIRIGQKQRIPAIGLSLLLDLDIANANAGKKAEDYPLFDGLTIKINHEHEPGDYKKVMVMPGHYTQISMQATTVHLLPRVMPATDKVQCQDNAKGLKKLQVLDNVPYTIGVCIMDCTQSVVLNSCGCVLGMDERYLKRAVFDKLANAADSICNVTAMKDCVGKLPYLLNLSPLIITAPSTNRAPCQRGNTVSEEKVAKMKSCAQACETPCNVWEYKTDLSSMVYPSTRYPTSICYEDKRWETTTTTTTTTTTSTTTTSTTVTGFNTKSEPFFLKNFTVLLPKLEWQEEETCTKTADYWRTNYIMLDISFSSLQYVAMIQKDSMTFDTFVSNIGGQIGLWLGASIVALIKFFIILFKFLCSKFRR